jgi:Rrf2 family protein
MRLELTRRGDYAVRTMLALAAAGEERLSARVIAERMAISTHFVPHVLRDLGKAGLVDGVVGRGGGYRLTRAADAISILDIVSAVEPDESQTRCVIRGGPCSVDGTCAVHDVFAGARTATLAHLSRVSLASVRRP